MPDGQTVVATLVEEDFLWAPDWGPGYLGVIRNAHTSGASLDQVVFATEFEPGTQMDTLVASVENGDGTASVLLMDTRGSVEGMTVFTWDPKAAESLSAAPTATWFPEGLELDEYFSFLAIPAGLRYQGFVFRHLTEWEPGSELLVWGRAPEDVGFGPTLASTIDGCTFTARVYDGLPPPEVPEPPTVIEDGTGCGSGCATGSPAPVGGLLTWLALVSAWPRARRGDR